ncbi:hypothetical protein [Phaeovulum vinaykumarii]|nr:hypothetical protein [Phaeovulum vinaykumarii]
MGKMMAENRQMGDAQTRDDDYMHQQPVAKAPQRSDDPSRETRQMGDSRTHRLTDWASI